MKVKVIRTTRQPQILSEAKSPEPLNLLKFCRQPSENYFWGDLLGGIRRVRPPIAKELQKQRVLIPLSFI